jgi:hypothetical protein
MERKYKNHDATKGKRTKKHMKKSLLQEDATDLDDFAADIAEQPLEDIETSEKRRVPVPNLSFFLN